MLLGSASEIDRLAHQVSELAIDDGGRDASRQCDHLKARIDHAPEYVPIRQLPLTAACTAFSNRAAKPALLLRSTLALQEPANSCSVPPKFAARQRPTH